MAKLSSSTTISPIDRAPKEIATSVREPSGENRYLRIRQVRATCGDVASSTIYRWVTEGTFPRPIRLGRGVSVWHRAEVEAWLDRCATPSATGEEA